MPSPDFEVVEFKDLSSEQKRSLNGKVNWRVDGVTEDWQELIDPDYGVRIVHVAILKNSQIKFDKYNIQLLPGRGGVFVLPMRIAPNNDLAQFYIPKERRILLRDINGIQGGVFTDNIPQGGINQDEKPRDAAIRETKEETGLEVIDIVHLGNVGLDIANSEYLSPFFLALVGYYSNQDKQTLEENEDINIGKWYSWNQIQQKIQKKEIIDSKTLSAFALTFGVLKPGLLGLTPFDRTKFKDDKDLTGATRLELKQQESFDKYLLSKVCHNT